MDEAKPAGVLVPRHKTVKKLSSLAGEAVGSTIMHGVEDRPERAGQRDLAAMGVRMVRTGLTRAFGAALRRAIAACSRKTASPPF